MKIFKKNNCVNKIKVRFKRNKRYCKERKINVSALHWVSEDCLEEMVVRNIEQVLTKFVLLFPARLPHLR